MKSERTYNPDPSSHLRMSRTKLELFKRCERCFYLDLRLNVKQPPGFPFSLNNAVDTLLKREFDLYREQAKPHPYMDSIGVKAIPFQHKNLEAWRDPLRAGIAFVHEPSRIELYGGVDDIWITDKDEIIIVDYKATSKEKEVTLDEPWQDGYRRQADIYAWLFLQNGFKLYPTAFFVYCNGLSTVARFDEKLIFEVKVLPYELSLGWIDEALINARKCLEGESIPKLTPTCDFCKYARKLKEKHIFETGFPQLAFDFEKA
jgi:hypothetical protein